MRKTPFLLLLSALLTACPSPIGIDPPLPAQAPRAFVPRAIGVGDTTVTLKGQNFDVKSASIDGVPVTILEQSAVQLTLKLDKPLGVGDFKLELINKSGKGFSSENGINVIPATSSNDEIDLERLLLTLKSPVTPKLEGLLKAAGFVLERQDLPQIAGGMGLCSQVIVTLKDSLASSRSVQDALNALAELLGPELNQGEFEPNPYVTQRGPDAYKASVLSNSNLTPLAIEPIPDYSQTNLRVAVLDTGVSKHAEFIYTDVNKVQQNIIDFAAGRNFTLEGNAANVQDLRANYPTDKGISNVGHGTGVAAAIAAPQGVAGIRSDLVVGIAPKVSILPVKVCDKDGKCNTPSLVAGICYAASLANATTKPVKVLNFSIGGQTPNRLLYLAFKDAAERGISVVVSAGNKALSNNPQMFPASYAADYSSNYPAIPGLIAVGSVLNSNGIYLPSAFSSWGPWVSLAAEGEAVALPESSDLSPNNTYGNFTGTSFAAPKVAGMVVRIKNVKPDWTPAEIKKFLVENSLEVPRCANKFCGSGRVNYTVLP